MIVQFYFMYGVKTNWRKRIKFSTIFKVVILCLVAILTFQMVGNLLGRNSTRDFTEYLAVYLSAEIKNLDIYLRKGNFGSDAYSNQTLIYVFNWLSGKFGLPEWSHELDIPFVYLNGVSLGNVYTTFYAFIYDLGYLGVVVFTFIMALLSQISYLKVMKTRINDLKSRVNINFIVYSYIFFTMVFSFFSNKFYENIFNMNFIYYLLFWALLKIYVEKLRLTKREPSSEQLRVSGKKRDSAVNEF